MRRFPKPILLGIGIAAAFAVQAPSAEPIQKHDGLTVWFDNWGGLVDAKLVVAAPDGKISEIYARTTSPVLSLNRIEAVDGIYRYEISASVIEPVKVSGFSNGENNQKQTNTGRGVYYHTGFFIVDRGNIIEPPQVKEEEQN